MKKFLTPIVLLLSLSSSAQISFTNLINQPPDNIVSIVADPTNNDIYAAATLKVIRSVNNGVSYTATANTGTVHLNLLYFTATGQLYAGTDKSNTNSVGLIKYNNATNVWSEVLGSPQNVTAIVEDNAGNLMLGTGTTGNYTAANPINKGNGFYYYNIVANTFTAINNGLANVAPYSVYPFIKTLVKNSTGVIFAATYGNGVYKWNGTLWSNYGTGLNNTYINTLTLNANDSLYAGTDAGITVVNNAGGAWSIISTGLPANKPVRTITIDVAGKMYAGLGFYHYQKGNMVGDLYTSGNNGSTWQNANTGYVGGAIYSILAHSSGNVFAGSAGVWKSANSGALWAYTMAGVKIANQTVKMVENSAGDIFVLCRNNQLGTRLPYGGVFRSTDNGTTWMQIVDGIKAQGLFEIFIDSHDNIWLSGSTIRPNANGSGTIWGTPELYKSTNNGITWVKNTSIVTASDAYNHIKETKNGKIYVASSFGTGVSNLSSSIDYNTFDNTLNLPPGNGGYSYGLAVNNANDVFHGTETNGIMRSTSNGAPGSFATVAAGGNTSVYVDPYSQYVFTNAGPDPTIHFNCSTDINNGTNIFALSNYPTFWANTQDMAFTNTGKIYCVVNSSHFNQAGLYLMQSPVTANSSFTMLINFGTLSFYFNTVYIDKCGYLYGVAQGGGISISTLPVNTPLQSTLNIPANNATGISLSPALSWTPVCTPDSFRLQIATDTLFTAIVTEQANILTSSYTVLNGTLSTNTKYFWRVYAVNAAGVGKWSEVSSFTTASVLPLRFISFEGMYKRTENMVLLNWITANENNNQQFNIERSGTDNIYYSIGTVLSSSQNEYSIQDHHPLKGKNYYRLKQIDADGKFTYSKIISVNTNRDIKNELIIFPNPVTDLCTVQLADTLNNYTIILTNTKGVVVLKMNNTINEKNITINLKGLPAGAYYIRIINLETKKSSKTQKIVKVE